MALFDSATISTQGAYVQMDGVTIAGATAFPGINSGSAPDIDITTLRSRAREYRSGFRDPGTVTIPVTLQPQTEVEASLREAADNGTQHQFTFRFGGTPDANTGFVANTALVVATDLGQYSVAHSAGVATLTFTAKAAAMPAVAIGDYIDIDGSEYKVTSVETGTNDVGVIKVSATSAPDDYDASASIVASVKRPGLKYVMTGSVQSFSTDINIDDVARGSLTLRLSGQAAITVGSPDLS